MKKFILLWILALPLVSFSQSGVLDRLKQKTKNRLDQRADEGMDKAIDKAEEEAGKKPKSDEEPNENHAATTEKTGSSGTTSFKTYSRYDFIPGENVLYAEDFSQDVIGEFPLEWATNNRGEAVTIEGYPHKWMRMFIGQFVSPEIKKLPENFTVEFDMFLTFVNSEEQSFGSIFPKFELQLLQLQPGKESARKFAQGDNDNSKVAVMIQPAYEDRTSIYIQSYYEREMYYEGGYKDLKKFSEHYRKPFHVAIWVQKQRLRLWINEEKVYDIPQAISPNIKFNHIGFWTADNSQEDNVGVYVSNINVAEGKPDMRSKLLTEGRLVTNGILFDVNSDKIRPESSGVLHEIGKVLKENASLKVKIIGHTDSDGDDTKNLDLSRRRAEAVKQALSTQMGIDSSRMLTDGKGEGQPVADNSSKEGKAKNRRVEFVKI